jgi:arylsulfatase A-like enzyme
MSKAVSNRPRLPSWLYAVVAVLLIGLWVVQGLQDRDPRNEGNVEDLVQLSERDDVNVFFILIDTLRADRLSGYGYERQTSPILDGLAERGVRFANHMSQSSWTKCSMASLWTSLNPARTGVLRYSHAIPEEATLPAEILSDAGFRTIGLWRNGWVAPNFGFEQGFDFYTRPSAAPVSQRARAQNPAGQVSGSDVDIVLSMEEALRSIGQDERFFLYVHMMDLHQYMSDKESAIFGTTYSDFYDNSIHWTDRIVGQMLAVLESRGLMENTLVVVASDHGEAFGEHGTEGHARNVYGETTNTPFIISFPFKLPGIVIESPTANVDVWPTILDLLGLPALPYSDGQSLAPELEAVIRGESVHRLDRLRVAHLDGTWGQPKKPARPLVAISRGGMRGVYDPNRPLEVYDESVDPGEGRDLRGERSDLAAEFETEVARYLDESEPPWQASNVEIDDLMLNQLRALGYKIE